MSASRRRTSLNPLLNPLATAHRGVHQVLHRQPLAPAHKQHGGKGVAEGLGGAGYSRDSCASLPISGVVQEASGLSAVGSEEATVQLSSVVPNPGSSDTSHLHNAAQVRPQ